MISHSVFRNNTQGHQNLLYIGGVVLTKNIKPKIIANDYRGVEMSIFWVKHKSIFLFIWHISLKFPFSKSLDFDETFALPVPTPLLLSMNVSSYPESW